MADLTNLFASVPAELQEEVFQTLLAAPGLRIERIVSRGQSSPDGFWYDGETHEWVLLLQGAARLKFENGNLLEMLPGTFVNISAHARHRVDWTDPNATTIWLAIHYTHEAVPA